MQVPSTVGFSVGMTVDIDLGTAAHEVNIIQAFGSLLFASPLKFPHPIGAAIAQAPIPTTTMPHLVYTSIVGVLQFTTTLTPLQSSQSSGCGDGYSLGSSSFAFGGSLNVGSSASDSWGSGESSGHHGSGSCGSALQIWQWILLAICCCCCCLGALAGCLKGGSKKRTKKTKKRVAPEPRREPVEQEREVLVPSYVPVQMLPPVTTVYSAY